jgi:hypothetical protein
MTARGSDAFCLGRAGAAGKTPMALLLARNTLHGQRPKATHGGLASRHPRVRCQPEGDYLPWAGSMLERTFRSAPPREQAAVRSWGVPTAAVDPKQAAGRPPTRLEQPSVERGGLIPELMRLSACLAAVHQTQQEDARSAAADRRLGVPAWLDRPIIVASSCPRLVGPATR